MAAQISHADLDRKLIRPVNLYYVINLLVTPCAKEYLLNILDVFSLLEEPTDTPNTGARAIMTGSTSSIDGVLVYFLTQIIPNIVREPIRKALVDIYRTLSSNVVSIASNLDGGRHGYLELTMAANN